MSAGSSKLFPLSEHQVLLFLLVTLFVVIVDVVTHESPIFQMFGDLQPCGELLTWELLIPIYIVGSQAYFGQVKPFFSTKTTVSMYMFYFCMNIHCIYYLYRIDYMHTSLYVSCVDSYKLYT